jgi:hypothetical protein
VLTENRIRDMQLFEIVVMGKEATVELIERFAAKGAPLIHCLEQAQHVLPNRHGVRVKIRVFAAIDKKFLKELRREGESLPHVLAKEDEDAAVENFLSEANKTPTRARKTPRAIAVSFKQGLIETFAKTPILGVECVFELPIFEALLSDQADEQRSTGCGDQCIAMKDFAEQEAIEASRFAG